MIIDFLEFYRKLYIMLYLYLEASFCLILLNNIEYFVMNFKNLQLFNNIYGIIIEKFVNTNQKFNVILTNTKMINNINQMSSFLRHTCLS